MGALKIIGGAVGRVVIGAALFTAGYFYGPDVEYIVRAVPKDNQMRIVYSGKGQTLETYIQQGKEKYSLDNFSINRVYGMPTKIQQLIATRITNERFTSTEKLGLVENLEGQLTEEDRYVHERATAVKLVERLTSEYLSPLNPFYRLQGPKTQDKQAEPGQQAPVQQPSQAPSQTPSSSASPSPAYTPAPSPQPSRTQSPKQSTAPSTAPAPKPTLIEETPKSDAPTPTPH